MKKTITSVLTIAVLGLAGCAQPGDTSGAALTTQLFAGIDAAGPGCSAAATVDQSPGRPVAWRSPWRPDPGRRRSAPWAACLRRVRSGWAV